MALKRPGTASRFVFLTTTFWALVMITALVAGHMALIGLIYTNFTDQGGLAAIAEYSGIPENLLWVSIFVAIALDGWIVYHQRLDRKKAMKR